MSDHCKSLALQFDLFVKNTLQILNTSTERDYMLNLKTIDELTRTMNESVTDKNTIKKTLESIQEECSKLSYKLKTSARLLDEVQKEKKKLEIEKETLKSQLEKLNNVFKKPNSSQISKIHHSLHERNTFNNTDALLSDLSYSQSEDSSNENIKKFKPEFNVQMNKNSTNNMCNDENKKTCEIKKLNINGGQITATTTLTMNNLGVVDAKSVINACQIPITKDSSSSFLESSSSLSENENKQRESNDADRSIKKEHNFIKQIVVIAEICVYCHKKFKFNNYMMKCMDCKIVVHLECKDHVSAICTLDQDKINEVHNSEQLHCTPNKSQFLTPKSSNRFFSSGLKRRILGSPKKIKAIKQGENKN